MPSKNKPKRLDRQRSVRVARRKRAQHNLMMGKTRTRAKRPKQKTATSLMPPLSAPTSQKTAPRSTEQKQSKPQRASKQHKSTTDKKS